MAQTLYRVGSRMATDTPGNIQHMVITSGVTATRYNVIYNNDASTAHQVASGKTLYVGYISFNGSASPSSIELYYGDTSVADSAAAPTNARFFRRFYSATSGINAEFENLFFPIPALKYPTINAIIGANPVCLFMGLEL